MKKCCSVLVFILFLSFMFVLKVDAEIVADCHSFKTNTGERNYFVRFQYRPEHDYDFTNYRTARINIFNNCTNSVCSYMDGSGNLSKNIIWFSSQNEVFYQMIKISKDQFENTKSWNYSSIEYYINLEMAKVFYDKIMAGPGINEISIYSKTSCQDAMNYGSHYFDEERQLIGCYEEKLRMDYTRNNFLNSIPTYNSSNWKKATKVNEDHYSAKVSEDGYYVVWMKSKVDGLDAYRAAVFHFEKQKVNETKSLEVGATYTLPVKGSGYKSSNTAVATVSNDGIITAKSGGTATITYTTDTTNYTIVINTYEMQIGTAPLLGDPITLKSGETATANNIEIKDGLTWFSDDEKIASVKNGVITGGYKGKTRVHAYNDTISYTVEVEVTSKPKAQGSKEIETILDGTVNIKDFYDKSILDTVISVKSENEKIATIDTSLNVKGASLGSTNVVIEYEDHFLEIAVNVLNKVEIKDENTSIPDENKNYLKLETKKIEENTKDYEEVKKKIKGITSFALYDINLYKDNQKIQPDSPIYLLLDIPKGYDQNKIVVYRIEENGSMTKLESTVENGKIKFLTNHFSYYIVAEETVQGESKTESVNIENLSNTTTPTTENNAKEEIENPQTGKVISITLILISILLIGAIIIYTRKNKKIFSI